MKVVGVLLITIALITSASAAVRTGFVPNKPFMIKSRDLSLATCLTVKTDKKRHRLAFQKCDSRAHQLWQPSKFGHLRSLSTGLCLSAGGKRANPKKLQLFTCNTKFKHQHWRIKKAGNLRNTTSTCLAIHTRNKSKAILDKCKTHKLMQWHLINDDGYAGATRHGKAGGLVKTGCPKGQFAHVAGSRHPWNGYCVSCPIGYQRTRAPIESPDACRFKK